MLYGWWRSQVHNLEEIYFIKEYKELKNIKYKKYDEVHEDG